MREQMPEYFYLYLSPDFFGLKKLASFLEGNLPLTSPSRFNDPFDTKFPFDYSNHHLDVTPEEQCAIDKGWSEESIQGIKQQQLEQDWQKKYLGCCFSDQWDSLLMWSHYADAHRGFCLQFKYSPEKLPTDCDFKPVRYSTHYPRIHAARVSEREETLLLTKSTDWMYENEWRFFAPSAEYGTTDGFDGLLEQSPFSLQQIYLGVCFDATPFTYDTDGTSWKQDKVARVTTALDEFAKVYLDQTKTPDAWELILNSLDDLRVIETEDTVQTAEWKRSIAQSIVTELINNHGMTVPVKKSADTFKLVVEEKHNWVTAAKGEN